MDLVEIRKKAKSRKPGKKKTTKKMPEKTAEKTAPVVKQPPGPVEEPAHAAPGDLPEETASTEEAVPMDLEPTTSAEDVEEIPGALTSLDDVFMSQRDEVKEEEEEQEEQPPRDPLVGAIGRGALDEDSCCHDAPYTRSTGGVPNNPDGLNNRTIINTTTAAAKLSSFGIGV